MEKTRITSAIENARVGIDKYLEIMRLFPVTDVSKDSEFQRKYNNFYKMRQRTQEFYQVYYGYMQDMKGKDLEFKDALKYFHSRLNRVEASFSSKLVATHNPDLPVWDQFILKNIGIRAPAYNENRRIDKIIAIYDQIRSWYQTFLNSEKAQLMIGLFDEKVNSSHMITDLKKIDFILWQTRPVKKEEQNRRLHLKRVEKIDDSITADTELDIVSIIKRKFQETGNPAYIEKLKGNGSISAKLSNDGVYVDNLGNQPFLPWVVFTKTISLLINNDGRAIRGDAMGSKLGDKKLPLNSIEGYVAHTVYNRKIGDSVFRRITPIACILIWVGVCKAGRGELILLPYNK